MTHPSDEEPTTLASSPPKPNLMTMPTEIILEIIGATEHGSLLAFARCTKRLNLLITPYIYQSVCYVHTEHTTYQSARYPDWASTHPKTAIASVTVRIPGSMMLPNCGEQSLGHRNFGRQLVQLVLSGVTTKMMTATSMFLTLYVSWPY